MTLLRRLQALCESCGTPIGKGDPPCTTELRLGANHDKGAVEVYSSYVCNADKREQERKPKGPPRPLLTRLQAFVFRPGELGLIRGRPTYWERLVFNAADRKLREREQAMRGDRT